jgi:replicative DNA helicase
MPDDRFDEDLEELPPMRPPVWNEVPFEWPLCHPSDIALDIFTQGLDKRRRGEVQGLPWPVEWPSLTRYVGPLEPGSLTIIAARPSVGKTMVGMHLLRSLCHNGHKVLFVTRELTVERIIRRHVVSYGADMMRLRTGNTADSDMKALDNFIADSKNWKVWYDDHSKTVEEVRASIAAYAPDCVIVDYLQRFSYDGDNEYKAITRLANEFQDVTLLTGTPIVLLSQLRRPEQGKEFKAPAMSDTRGSGAVEERAANLILLHRDWDTIDEDKNGKPTTVAKSAKSEGWFIVAKAADGESDKFIRVDFNGARMSVQERL